jgi:hypothetical protein
LECPEPALEGKTRCPEHLQANAEAAKRLYKERQRESRLRFVEKARKAREVRIDPGSLPIRSMYAYLAVAKREGRDFDQSWNRSFRLVLTELDSDWERVFWRSVFLSTCRGWRDAYEDTGKPLTISPALLDVLEGPRGGIKATWHVIA